MFFSAKDRIPSPESGPSSIATSVRTRHVDLGWPGTVTISHTKNGISLDTYNGYITRISQLREVARVLVEIADNIEKEA